MQFRFEIIHLCILAVAIILFEAKNQIASLARSKYFENELKLFYTQFRLCKSDGKKNLLRNTSSKLTTCRMLCHALYFFPSH